MLLAVYLALTAFSIPASAYDYTFTGPDSGLFGEPTSDSTTYIPVRNDTNIDRSKTAAIIPPRFGSPTSYTLNSGELLTPNLVNQSGGTAANSSIGTTVMPPSMTPAQSKAVTPAYGFTSLTPDLYYSDGSIGTLKIPAINLTVKTYEGTDSAALLKGVGHFSNTSLWSGNVAFAAHNRGVTNHFGKIHTLNVGDTITYTTKLGTRSYAVHSVSKIAVDDLSVLNDSATNIITLVTCVMDQPQYRWCVKASEKV